MKYDSYEDLVDGLKKIPVTWYPAIIKVVILESFKRNIWLGTKGLIHFIHNIIEEEIS